MPLLEIYFFGLISHTGSDANAKRSVLINFTDHKAKVVTSAGAEKEIAAGAHVHFNGLGAEPQLSQNFRDYIPSLKTVTRSGNDLLDDVKSEKNATEVQAFVHLPDGDLDIADFYNKQATHTLDSVDVRPMNCVGRLALLTCIVNDAAATVNVGSSTLIIPVPGWILFSNGSDAGTKDFHAHRLITKAPNNAYIATVKEGSPCPLSDTWQKGIYYEKVASIVNTYRDSAQVECSNTRWP